MLISLRLVFVLMVIIFIASASMPEQRKFKNLKVLPKNISEEELDKHMRGFSKALGVKCVFCHVKDNDSGKFDMASDAKPEKLIARRMIKMTEQINKKYFDHNKESNISAVSCNTCHRGIPHPDTIQVSLMESKRRSAIQNPGIRGDSSVLR